MKKLILSALAIASLVACSKDEVVSQQSPAAIAFSGAFVDNATRAATDPSTTTESIKNFDVWGFMDNTNGVIFDNEDVTKVGVNWTYTNTQYWSPNHTYYFAAVSPMNSKNVSVAPVTGDAATVGLGIVDFMNVDGTEDLLYAKEMVTVGEEVPAEPVKFTFNHLLSKVKFTFANGFTNENSQIVVKNITMTAPYGGSINLASETPAWVLGADTNAQPLTLSFGDVNRLAPSNSNECANERLTIPAAASQKYTVKFTVELYQGDVLAQTFNEETTIEGVELEMGNAYNFKATLNASNLGLKPIVFDVEEVADWVDAGEQTVALKDVTVDGGSLTLVGDGVAANTIKVSNDGTLDGAGNTLSVADDANLEEFLTSNSLRYITTSNSATIKNLTIDGENTKHGKYGIRAIFLTGEGDVVIDNVDIKNVTYPINTGDITGEGIALSVSNSTLEGWSSWDGTKSASFTNVVFSKNYQNELGNVRPYHSTVFANCTFNDVKLDLTMLEADQIITIIDCKYANGTPVTDANISSLLVDGVGASSIEFPVTVANVAAGSTTTMDEDAVTVSSVKVEGGDTDADAATLNGGGYTLTVAGTPGDNAVVRPSGNANITDLTIDGQNANYTGTNDTVYGIRAIYITKGGVYNISNVNIFNVTYTMNVNTTQPVTLNVSDSTLAGWTSYGSSTTATFTNVNFKVGSLQQTFRPHGNTTLTNCTFEKGMIILLDLLGNRSITFENCYYDGVKITADNYASIVEGEVAESTITCK